MYRVYITDCLGPPVEPEERVLRGLASVTCLQATSVDELEGVLRDADGIVIYHEISLPARIIDELQRCKVIVRGGVGYDNVDLEAAGRRKIPVCNVPDYGVDEVADHAIGLMLACNRGILLAERRLQRDLEPWGREAVEPVFRITGATMGIVGCGRIGAATARRALALKMQVLIYDPYLRPGMEKALGVTRVERLESLLTQCDVVSMHTPLTPETRHLIDAEALSLMKPTSYLINTARGSVVDVEALAKALQQRKIAGAGIDVLPMEPPHVDMPLIRLWRQQAQSRSPLNLILTPHTAYYSEAALMEIRVKSAEEIARVLRGRPPLNCVNGVQS